MLRLLKSSKFMVIIVGLVAGFGVYSLFGGGDLTPELKMVIIKHVLTLLGVGVSLYITATAGEDIAKKIAKNPLDIIKEGYEAVRSLSSADKDKINKEVGEFISMFSDITGGSDDTVAPFPTNPSVRGNVSDEG